MRPTSARKARRAPRGAASPADRKEQKRAEAEARQKLAQQRKPLQNRINKLETELERLNAEKAKLDAFVADPTSYEPARKTELTEALRKQADISARLVQVETDWLDAQEALEELGSASAS